VYREQLMAAIHLYPWLESTWQRLLQLYNSQRVPHALLISGAKGLGKANLIHAFEKLLLCQAPAEGACGTCRSCYLFEQNHHPDLRRLGEDAKTIGIDEIRELTHFLDQTSHQQGYKVVTLFQGDQLSHGSANALLKTLEEPLGKTVLLLVAEQPQNMLATLKSRCTHVHIVLPPLPVSLAWLQSNYSENDKYLQQCLALAAGSPLRAREFLDADTGNWRSALTKAILIEPKSAFDSEDIQQFIANQPREALYLFYYWVAEVTRFALQASTGYLYTGSEVKHLEHLVRKIPLKKIFTFFEYLTESIKTLSLPGTNKQLLFETLFYRWELLCSEGGSV